MKMSRRRFVHTCGALGAAALWTPAFAQTPPAAHRVFHLSMSPAAAIENDPELLSAIAAAGVSDLWIGGSWTGIWLDTPEKVQSLRPRIEEHGLRVHMLNVPLGHPGTANPKWKPAVLPDGSTCTGTSLHKPATETNCAALRQIAAAGFDRVFLDDDFRLTTTPGIIGGCFCDEHRRDFLQRTGFDDGRWAELLDDVRARRLTPLLRAWLDYQCDQLTACFRAQQDAVPGVQLGIMVMYFGAEKAGVRLTDYADVPLRVGEFIFSDEAFNPVKGKTNELYSSLFHRRFVAPELAYSETTAFPNKALSLQNKIAKLAVSTLSDVRNTMFMCDFPKEHWAPLAPAIKHHAQIHAAIAGHTPRGPLKHFWGEAARYVGNDDPYSLPLALGIPFEVTAEPAADGFTFLCDADAAALAGRQSPGTTWLARPQTGLPDGVRPLAESLPELFAWKQQVLPQLANIPYIEGNVPVVCAWYPTARAAVLWNLTETTQNLNLRHGHARREVRVDPLGVALVEGLAG
ncbi:MAG: hypothetical protein JW888_18495 [Pirellulales bacterium]|nr:hypothetical protein [Pirellulales bacterium]